MQRILTSACLLAIAATSFSSAPVLASEKVEAPCQASTIPVNGHDLWVDKRGSGTPTVVFEAGGGNDSSVWTDLVPKVQKLGVTTFVYDRAGLGKSAVDPSAYRIEREVAALHSALDQCEVSAPVIIVAHSYGGVIALLASSDDPRIAGIVLLDAVVPGFYDESRLNKLLAKYRPQYDEVRAKAPQLAQTMIPMMEAYPATTHSLDAAAIPETLPIIDIVAEHPAETEPADIEAWKSAHATFVANHPHREAVQASNSGHHVAKDRPDLVIDAIARMVEITQDQKTPAANASPAAASPTGSPHAATAW